MSINDFFYPSFKQTIFHTENIVFITRPNTGSQKNNFQSINLILFKSSDILCLKLLFVEF